MVKFKKSQAEQEECYHVNAIPNYPDDAFDNLSSAEVRKRFPRFFGDCPDCGQPFIGYSSLKHYISGDW